MLPNKWIFLFALVFACSPCAGAQSNSENAPPDDQSARETASQSTKPNVVVILADDLGFSDLGCYGSQIRTPNLDSLAQRGLRYAQFYNTARCWPTRAALMTGYYPQQIGMDPPQKELPKWTRMLSHYLATAGYRSYHSGKWHIRAAENVVAQGGFDRSFKIIDQDRFFSPRRLSLDDQNLPPVKNDGSFYATEAIGEYGVKFLSEHREQHAEKPFFLYLAFTSPHFPLHALQEDVQKYKQTFTAGWDHHRRQRLALLKKSGILPNAELSSREPGTVPAWNLAAEKLREEIGPGEVPNAVPWETLTEEQKEFQALKMAIHAAMVDRMDQVIGRVLSQLREMDALENTLILFCSDNGASAEQIIRGDQHDPEAVPGSAESYLCLGPGWSTAANTPFRRHKSWVHEGGISTPLIVHWPNGFAAQGEIRREAVGHVIDIVPTVLDVVGVDWKPEWNETTAPPLAGKSLVPSFATDVPIEREFLYFSHDGHHALRQGDWKVVSADDNSVDWALYNLAEDRDESNNLTPLHRERMTKMQLFWNQINRDMRAQANHK